MKRSRILVYRFFELPNVVRLSISQDLGLVRDEDTPMHNTEFFHQVLKRAKDEHLLAELWDRVEAKHDDKQFADNPYRTKKGA